MGSRRKSRQFALQLLYQLDLRKCLVAELLSTFWTDTVFEPDERAFAEGILRGVAGKKAEIDGLIEEQSINWKMSRMPLVDRNILRLGVYELAYIPGVPVSATLNEAIELGKRYGSRESGAFINGILDKVARRVASNKDETSPVVCDDEGDYMDDDSDDEPE